MVCRVVGCEPLGQTRVWCGTRPCLAQPPRCRVPGVLQDTCHYAISGPSRSLYRVIFVPAPPRLSSGLVYPCVPAQRWGDHRRFRAPKAKVSKPILALHDSSCHKQTGNWAKSNPPSWQPIAVSAATKKYLARPQSFSCHAEVSCQPGRKVGVRA